MAQVEHWTHDDYMGVYWGRYTGVLPRQENPLPAKVSSGQFACHRFRPDLYLPIVSIAAHIALRLVDLASHRHHDRTIGLLGLEKETWPTTA